MKQIKKSLLIIFIAVTALLFASLALDAMFTSMTTLETRLLVVGILISCGLMIVALTIALRKDR